MIGRYEVVAPQLHQLTHILALFGVIRHQTVVLRGGSGLCTTELRAPGHGTGMTLCDGLQIAGVGHDLAHYGRVVFRLGAGGVVGMPSG